MIAVRLLDIGLDAAWQRGPRRRRRCIRGGGTEHGRARDGDNGQNALHVRSFLQRFVMKIERYRGRSVPAQKMLRCRRENEYSTTSYSPIEQIVRQCTCDNAGQAIRGGACAEERVLPQLQ
jgi:hypothetical protein